MNLINISKIIEKSKESGELPERTLKVIEKMIYTDNRINQMIEDGLKNFRESKEMDVIQEENNYFFEHKQEILTQMVKVAYHKLMFKGSDEMVKYLDENFDIFLLSDREKKELLLIKNAK
jgi:hypothetical protein